MRRSIILFFSLLISLSACLKAQDAIEVRLEYKENVNFQFTDEWQYLSTDIYLFNADKFTAILNQVIGNKRKWRSGDEIENLLITAQIKEVSLMGTKDIVYPLFNFQITKEGSNAYKTQASSSIEVIRVIDKLPISSQLEHIDADIKLKTVTQNLGKELFNLAAEQLLNVSTIENPTDAILSLVGELGKFIISNTEKRDYMFSSTIRLYEDHNFDMKLHSFRIYTFIPNNERSPYYSTKKLSDILQSATTPKIERKELEEMIAQRKYPYMVVVNYKSLYRLDVLTGDEISKETIEKRKVKVESARTQGLIKDEPYRQEKYFIEYLELFNNLKNSLNLYKLNYEIRNTDAIKINLFTVIQDFGNLKRTYNERMRVFSSNKTFTKLFKSEYESIFANSELYLEKDAYLNNCKDIVNSLFELEASNLDTLTDESMERYLRVFHSIQLPKAEFLAESVEGQRITKIIDNLENKLYDKIYEQQIIALHNLPANNNNLSQRNDLKNKVKGTNCKLCRDKAIEAISEYNDRYETYQVSFVKVIKDSLIRDAGTRIFDFFQRTDCVSTNLKNEEVVNRLGSSKDFIIKQHEDLNKKINELQKMITENPDFEKLSEINDFTSKIENLTKEIKEGYDNICKRYPELCSCE